MDREKLREELRVHLRRRPFQPFRIHLKDGQAVDALLPDMHILGEGYIDIGFPEANEPDPYCDHSVIVPFSTIDRVELLSPANQATTAVGG